MEKGAIIILGIKRVASSLNVTTKRVNHVKTNLKIIYLV